jgi:hypothetical protein
MSPSLMVWIGRIVRARPSCAICAILVASALPTTASVATIASVVALLVGGGARVGDRPFAAPERRHRVEEALAVGGAGAGDDPAVRRIDHVAHRVDRDQRRDRDAATLIEAVPRPPRIAWPMPNSLPIIAPAPAPTLPSAGASRVAAAQAA